MRYEVMVGGAVIVQMRCLAGSGVSAMLGKIADIVNVARIDAVRFVTPKPADGRRGAEVAV